MSKFKKILRVLIGDEEEKKSDYETRWYILNADGIPVRSTEKEYEKWISENKTVLRSVVVGEITVTQNFLGYQSSMYNKIENIENTFNFYQITVMDSFMNIQYNYWGSKDTYKDLYWKAVGKAMIHTFEQHADFSIFYQ